MIPEFVVAIILTWTFTYLILKLVDQYKIRRIKKKFPEGSETKSIPVDRLDSVPTRGKQENKLPEELVKTLKEVPTEEIKKAYSEEAK